MTTAYDLALGDAPARPSLFAGWAGPEGPAIGAAEWPRAPRTGQPMLHCATLWLPEDYRRRGTEHPALAVFQWFDQRSFGFPVTGDVVGHPDAGAFYAVRWLTEAQLTGERTTRPEPSGPLTEDEFPPREGPNTAGALWLVERDDPNAGTPPFDDGVTPAGYVELPDRHDRFSMQHLGGTLMSPDGPDRSTISPWYLELTGIGGFDFAGGDALVLDLDARTVLG